MLAPSEKCTGCMACSSSCPIVCISNILDSEGFYQPVIDNERCIECGRCTKSCPVLQATTKNCSYEPIVYAAWNKDTNVLEKSSSGGIFGVFARYIIEKGGVVFGAAYSEDLSVRHVEINSIEELSLLQGSKYVQSDIGESFKSAKMALEESRYVLFTGTPCQIAGLYGFLGGDKFDKLYTCDLVCHGVPSPGVFREYIDYLEVRENAKLKGIEMRTKSKGWMQGSEMKLIFTDKKLNIYPPSKDPYMNGFMYSTFLRKTCYNCQYAKTPRESDLTLGDFWDIGNDITFNYPTRQGVSLVLINSDRGEGLFKDCNENIIYEKRTLEEAKKGNVMLSAYQRSNLYREQFFIDSQKKSFEELMPIYLKRRQSFIDSLKKTIVNVVGRNNTKRIKRMIVKT